MSSNGPFNRAYLVSFNQTTAESDAPVETAANYPNKWAPLLLLAIAAWSLNYFLIGPDVYVPVYVAIVVLLIAKLFHQVRDQANKISILEEKFDVLLRRESGNKDAKLQQNRVTRQAAMSSVQEELGVLKEELKKLEADAARNEKPGRPTVFELGKQISGRALSKMGKCFKNEHEELAESKRKDESKKTDIYQNGTDSTFELKGIYGLLGGLKKERTSVEFYCRGIPWLLRARINLVDEVYYLGLWLQHKIVLDKRYWSIVATLEIRLLSSKSGLVDGDVVWAFQDVTLFNPDVRNSIGFKKFIAVDKLRTGSFIQNDTINVRVRLLIKSFEEVAH